MNWGRGEQAAQAVPPILIRPKLKKKLARIQALAKIESGSNQTMLVRICKPDLEYPEKQLFIV